MRRRPVVTSWAAAEKRRSSRRRGSQSRAFATQCKYRHPGEQVQGGLDDLQPDMVLRGVVQWRITQASGAGGADAVLGPGPLPVTQFEGGDRLTRRVGGEADQPHAVGVDEAQLGAGVWPFLAHDQSQPHRSAGQAVAGEFGAPGAVADVAFGLNGRRPGRGRDLQDGLVDGPEHRRDHGRLNERYSRGEGALGPAARRSLHQAGAVRRFEGATVKADYARKYLARAGTVLYGPGTVCRRSAAVKAREGPPRPRPLRQQRLQRRPLIGREIARLHEA
jgi:hypothetical protein